MSHSGLVPESEIEPKSSESNAGALSLKSHSHQKQTPVVGQLADEHMLVC